MKPADDKAAGLRIIDIALEDTGIRPAEEFLRQVRLLECVREVIERAHGQPYWAMIYDAADVLRRQKAERLAAQARGEEPWET